MLKFQRFVNILLSSYMIETFRNGIFAKVERALFMPIRYKNTAIAIYNFSCLALLS